jgi:transposase-like protein
MLLHDPRWKKSPKRRLPNQFKARYSDSQKLEAVKLWLVIGNLTQVAATLDIPYETIKAWKISEWWSELVTDLRSEDNIQLSAKLKTIVVKSLTQVEDRLEGGDYIFNSKTGELVRKPLSAKDAMKVATDAIDRADRLSERPKDDSEQSLAKLEDLAKRFEALALKTQPLQVTDVIYVSEPSVLQVSEDIPGSGVPESVPEVQGE